MNKSKVQEVREAKGLTQIQLAEKAGISLSSLRNFEQGMQPTNRIKRSIAVALGVRLVEIGGPNVARHATEPGEGSQAERKFNERIPIFFNDLMLKADPVEQMIIDDDDNLHGFQEILFLARKHGVDLPDLK